MSRESTAVSGRYVEFFSRYQISIQEPFDCSSSLVKRVHTKKRQFRMFECFLSQSYEILVNKNFCEAIEGRL